MAPRPREAPPASTGLLASAFNFVSREIESFVTAATGGEVSKQQPEASSSRVTLDGKRRKREDGRTEKDRERERRVKRVRKRSEVETDRARARRKLREEVDGDRAVRTTKKSKEVLQQERESVRERERERSSEREAADDEDDELPVRPLPKSLKKRRELAARTVELHEEAEDAPEPPVQPQQKKTTGPSKLMPPPPNPMPPPPVPPTPRTMTPFPTMPGSLFPRSESMIPESIPASYRRAAPRPRTPSPPPLPALLESTEDDPPEVLEPPDVRLSEPPEQGRGRERQDKHERDRSRLSTSRESPRPNKGSSRAASKPRGSTEEPSETLPRARSAKGKERAYDTSGEIRVQGKERELREAREDHARNAHDRDNNEREKDKQRIRMLEEEVVRLRAELALKSSPSMMPPPPPPPPPPMIRTQVPVDSSGGHTNFLASARANLKPTAPPVEAPINAVPYGGARTRKTGQPTLNLSSDKMAAFLREMKTVRLRKVAGAAGSMGPPSFPASAAGDVAGELTRSTGGTNMSDARRAAILGDASFDAGVAARMFIGEKRKRDILDEPVAGPSKRRETAFVRSNNTGGSSSTSSSQSSATSSQSSASASSSQSSASGSTSQSSISRSSLFDTVPSQPRTSRVSKTQTALQIWPTRSTETDVTTPSLCSDNENDHSEDKLPETPSDSGRGNPDDAQSVQPREHRPQEEPEIIDVDALETPPRRQSDAEALSFAEAREREDAFKRRPPASPMPSRSPVKPKPPARGKAKVPVQVSMPSKLPLPRRVPINPPLADDGSESDDPLIKPRSRTHSRGRSVNEREDVPSAGPSRVPRERSEVSSQRSRSQSRSQAYSHPQPEPDPERKESRLSNHARRRLTLDEELRRAGDSLWRDEDEEPERPPSAPPEDLDSGHLVAMGTKSSRRGFLARGGGAGAPVFMGEGYVQGAVPEGAEERVRRSRSGSRNSVTTVVRRRRDG